MSLKSGKRELSAFRSSSCHALQPTTSVSATHFALSIAYSRFDVSGAWSLSGRYALRSAWCSRRLPSTFQHGNVRALLSLFYSFDSSPCRHSHDIFSCFLAACAEKKWGGGGRRCMQPCRISAWANGYITDCSKFMVHYARLIYKQAHIHGSNKSDTQVHKSRHGKCCRTQKKLQAMKIGARTRLVSN